MQALRWAADEVYCRIVSFYKRYRNPSTSEKREAPRCIPAEGRRGPGPPGPPGPPTGQKHTDYCVALTHNTQHATDVPMLLLTCHHDQKNKRDDFFGKPTRGSAEGGPRAQNRAGIHCTNPGVVQRQGPGTRAEGPETGTRAEGPETGTRAEGPGPRDPSNA